MSNRTFDTLIQTYLETEKNDVNSFLIMNKSVSNYQGYNDFFDIFLSNYGVMTFAIFGDLDENNLVIPQIDVVEKNIFKLPAGEHYLSEQPISQQLAAEKMASFLIQQLQKLTINDFRITR